MPDAPDTPDADHDGLHLALALAERHVDPESLTPEQLDAALAEMRGAGTGTEADPA